MDGVRMQSNEQGRFEALSLCHSATLAGLPSERSQSVVLPERGGGDSIEELCW
jgi:hypothetical protein